MSAQWDDAGGGWIEDENGDSVVEYAGCGSHKAEWATDGHFALALAAPQLLEALQYARRALFDHSDMRYIAPAVEKIDAALALASGEKQT